MDKILVQRDGSFISGLKGSRVHIHDFGLGIGHIKDQETGRKITHFNNFTRDVDTMHPPWMKNKK